MSKELALLHSRSQVRVDKELFWPGAADSLGWGIALVKHRPVMWFWAEFICVASGSISENMQWQ